MSAIVKQSDNTPATQQEGVTILSVISRAASDPNVDIEKLERLMVMKERMDARQAEREFNEAMSAAQSEMGRISTDATNPQTRSRYATYGKLDSCLRPIYTRHGFALSYGTRRSELEGHITILCDVSHKGGHVKQYECDMPADGKGAKGGDVMTKTHAAGSAMSYGQRYLLKLIFNVAIGENDDDGNSAGSGFDISSWRDKIDGASDKTELDSIANELRGSNSIPPAAMRSIRALWSAKAKELAQ
jgi:hypothetical protein